MCTLIKSNSGRITGTSVINERNVCGIMIADVAFFTEDCLRCDACRAVETYPVQNVSCPVQMPHIVFRTPHILLRTPHILFRTPLILFRRLIMCRTPHILLRTSLILFRTHHPLSCLERLISCSECRFCSDASCPVRTPHIVFRTPHILLRTPLILTRTPHILFRTPHILFRTPLILIRKHPISC
jgi:ferredoxin